jgi:hypothetical protein
MLDSVNYLIAVAGELDKGPEVHHFRHRALRRVDIAERVQFHPPRASTERRRDESRYVDEIY